jgi:hypothetical protein
MNKSILSLALVLSVVAAGAHAERRTIIDRSLNINANAHGSITRQSERPAADSSLVRDLTRTNARGETATRTDVITRDGENGSSSRIVSGVTADGRSYSGESTITRTESGLTREGSVTGSEGNSRSGSTSVAIDKDNGTLTKQLTASRTNRNGGTTTLSGESVISRTDDGLVRETNLSNSNGGSRSGSSSLIVDKEAGTITKEMAATRTNRDGETTNVSSQSLLARTDDGFTRESSQTDAAGNTRTRSVDASVNKAEGSFTKQVKATGPNGQASTSTVITREPAGTDAE